MLKKWLLGLMLLILTSTALADEASVRKAFQQAYPKVKIESVTKTQYGGLYEVYAGGQLVYTDENFNFFIVDGRLIDVKNRRDITTERTEELSRIDFSALPLEQAIKVVKGNGSRKMAVFSDPDCPYCKQLEQEGLAPITDVTIYTFLFPIERLHPNAPDKAKAIWCAPDRGRAWTSWMLKSYLPQGNTSCSTPLDSVSALAQKLGVNSTPTLFFADGTRLRGAYPTEDIEKALNLASKKPQK
ncbi:MAG TPA: DsbC family protein [Methylophilaceae bacterium]|jgi:thiol:disulfide interchange protein DsbC